ncbi:MAG TPA: hypothetical protein VL742_17885 [Casimicrobiaceae bacterium]|nr:hypothetical protein [Casimicrobiaceae bacterium]
MIELERRGTAHAAHECSDERSVCSLDAIDARAFEGFAGDFALERIERLVRVHDQQVQRIASFAGARGKFFDGHRVHLVAGNPDRPLELIQAA